MEYLPNLCFVGFLFKKEKIPTRKKRKREIAAVYEGTQPEFPFPNSGDPSGTPTNWKKNKPLFRLNLFKSESVERTHLYSYVFH